MCNCQMCLNGMPAFCLGTSSESNQAFQDIEETHSSTDDREDGELDADYLLPETTGDSEADQEDIRLSLRTRSNARRSSKRGRTSSLSNSQSSGRKLAAKLFPLHADDPCEWQGLGNCGGGKFPILGCLRGIQQARHHGPDKNVSNNTTGNVHRICHACHVRWHKVNDPDYDWNDTNPIQHNPRKMTDDEVREAAMLELKYQASKVKVIADE